MTAYAMSLGFGGNCDNEVRDYWKSQGDDGRKRVRMADIDLRERDGLYGRLFKVWCPVMLLHGISNVFYFVANME